MENIGILAIFFSGLGLGILWAEIKHKRNFTKVFIIPDAKLIEIIANELTRLQMEQALKFWGNYMLAEHIVKVIKQEKSMRIHNKINYD